MAEIKGLISAKEARKLLGQRSKNLTNDELEELILNTETVVRIAVRQFVGSINSNNGANMNSERTNQL